MKKYADYQNMIVTGEYSDKCNWIICKKGCYGGTFVRKDIAFEFASAISPVLFDTELQLS